MRFIPRPSRRSWRITAFLLTLAGAALSAVLWVWRVYILLRSSAWYLLVLGGGVAFLVYGAVLVALGLEDDEIQMLRTLPKRLARLGFRSHSSTNTPPRVIQDASTVGELYADSD